MYTDSPYRRTTECVLPVGDMNNGQVEFLFFFRFLFLKKNYGYNIENIGGVCVCDGGEVVVKT